MGKKLEILSGHKFGHLTVIKELDGRPRKPRGVRRIFECICVCGKTTNSTLTSMVRRPDTSCGCIRTERIVKFNTKHGMSNSTEYRTRVKIIDRCYNKKNNRYYCYGERGIIVCDRWLESFENFYADMGPKPTPKHSIDRIDVNGNYEPSNCRWATVIEQANNKR